MTQSPPGTQDPRHRPRTALRALVALAIPLGVAIAGVAVLQQPFDSLRLATKSAIPFAALVPAALLLRRGAPFDVASVVLLCAATVGATLACIAVFGVPLDVRVLVPLLSLERTDQVLIVGLLAAAVALFRWRVRGEAGPSPADALVALVESIYFGGFLLASTAPLGIGSWALVGAGLVLSALVRGAPAPRALVGATAFVGVMLWSGSPWAGCLAHAALLNAPASRAYGVSAAA